jgi:hypothetical protein
MDAPATLVWIAPDAPDAQQSRAMSSWALAHSVKLVAPPIERPPALASNGGEHVSDDVEILLERARDAIVAHDAEGADRALSDAESLLRVHPEVPQAAWLMAELERCRSTRWSRMPSPDPEAAERAWKRADALDGGRVPGISEKAFAEKPPAATVRIDLAPARGVQAWLDGKPIAANTVDSHAGLHALVVTWAGVPVWAEWIESPPGNSSVAADAPSPSPCSQSDIAQTTIVDGAVYARNIRCAHWVAASPFGTSGEISLATCEADACGPWVRWHASEPWTWAPQSPATNQSDRDRGGRWPAWATWGAVGVGAAVVTGAAVILVDALRPAQTETRFVNNGLERE